MSLVMTARITFDAHEGRRKIVLRKVTSVVIETSWKTLTDTAEITLPRNVKFFDNQNVKEVFRKGDPVTIELGYDERFVTEFQGYISTVSADTPIIIKCDDEMYNLKKMKAHYTSKSVTLDKLIKDLVKGYDIDVLQGVQLGGVRFANTTVYKVLEKLQDNPYNLHSYFKGKQLVVGKYYADDAANNPYKLRLEKNVVSNELTYRSREDVILKINATSVLVNGKSIKYELGEDGGDVLNLNYYNIEVKAELEKKVKQDYDRRKQGGLDGTVTLFGIPSVAHGGVANIESRRYPDRNGSYYIDTIRKEFDDTPKYRQIVTLGNNVR